MSVPSCTAGALKYLRNKPVLNIYLTDSLSIDAGTVKVRFLFLYSSNPLDSDMTAGGALEELLETILLL